MTSPSGLTPTPGGPFVPADWGEGTILRYGIPSGGGDGDEEHAVAVMLAWILLLVVCALCGAAVC